MRLLFSSASRTRVTPISIFLMCFAHRTVWSLIGFSNASASFAVKTPTPCACSIKPVRSWTTSVASLRMFQPAITWQSTRDAVRKARIPDRYTCVCDSMIHTACSRVLGCPPTPKNLTKCSWACLCARAKAIKTVRVLTSLATSAEISSRRNLALNTVRNLTRRKTRMTRIARRTRLVRIIWASDPRAPFWPWPHTSRTIPTTPEAKRTTSNIFDTDLKYLIPWAKTITENSKKNIALKTISNISQTPVCCACAEADAVSKSTWQTFRMIVPVINMLKHNEFAMRRMLTLASTKR
mmetsp:Transcript_41206/g.124410  ORF Transcript_41206/g.124410 Transcript_41206/m.124410 type:complete len:295 (+) Transcript_41206:251-1135(+)